MTTPAHDAAAMREAAAKIADAHHTAWAISKGRDPAEYASGFSLVAAAIRALPTAEAKTQGNLNSQWKCPINHKGCTKDCGSYGCGN